MAGTTHMKICFKTALERHSKEIQNYSKKGDKNLNSLKFEYNPAFLDIVWGIISSDILQRVLFHLPC